jgi:ubiquinone/menaquinone biosynthesis C-methylase UbiE
MHTASDQLTNLEDIEAYDAEIEARPDELALEFACAEAVHDVLDNQPRAAVLDLCCGTGRSLSWVLNHRNVSKAVGVDLSPVCLEFARKRFGSDERLELIEEDAVSVALPAAQWDVILLSRAYHHIEDERKSAFLQHVSHRLGPSGKAVIADSLLPPYDEVDPVSHKEALRAFFQQVLLGMDEPDSVSPRHIHEAIRSKALTGQDDDGDYKVSVAVLHRHLRESGLTILQQAKAWPIEGSTGFASGGTYVFVTGR